MAVEEPIRRYYEGDSYHVVMPVQVNPFPFVPADLVFIDSWPCEFPDSTQPMDPVRTKFIHFQFVKRGSVLYAKLRARISDRAKKKADAAQ